MAPDIGAVMGHIEGQIAQDLHPQAAGQRQQPQPLDLQLPLQQGLLQQGVLLVPVERGQGPALAAGQGFGPLPPGRLAVEPAQHHEAAMVLQPELLLEGPGFKAAALVLALVRPALPQPASQELGALGRRRQVEAGAGARRQGIEVSRLQQAVVHQGLAIEQPGVEGKAAGGAIGGAAAIGGGQGQQLPHPHALGGEQLNPGGGGLAKTAAGRGSGQGRGVQQHSAATAWG